MNKKDLNEKLDVFLQEAQEKNETFYGRNLKSKIFNIYGICGDMVIIKYDSYPKHFVLEKEVLLDGIDKVINHKEKINLTSEYADKIEFSIVHRKGTENKTSVLTKFYFSIHNAFLQMVKKENVKK